MPGTVTRVKIIFVIITLLVVRARRRFMRDTCVIFHFYYSSEDSRAGHVPMVSVSSTGRAVMADKERIANFEIINRADRARITVK